MLSPPSTDPIELLKSATASLLDAQASMDDQLQRTIDAVAELDAKLTFVMRFFKIRRASPIIGAEPVVLALAEYWQAHRDALVAALDALPPSDADAAQAPLQVPSPTPKNVS